MEEKIKEVKEGIMIRGKMICTQDDFKNYVIDQNKQLQAYKDREDNVKEYLNNVELDPYTTLPTTRYWVNDIEKIIEREGVE